MTAIEAMLHQPAAHAVGSALVQFVWQGTLIGVVTAVILVALRRSAADIRYVVSAIALVLMLTVPIVTTVQSLRGEGRTPDQARADQAGLLESAPPVAALGASGPERQPLLPIEGVASGLGASEPLARWRPVLVSLWLMGVAVLTLRLLSGWILVQRLKTQGVRPADNLVKDLAARLMRRLHIRRAIRLVESSVVDVPTVIGWLKPVVLLPASALSGLTPRQLEAVLAHELAHIRRHDYLVNLVQTVVETLLFYHPAVWWLSRRVRTERENCCDDLAVSLCGDPVAYAAALAEIEGLRGTRGRLVLAASGGSLLQRIRRVLGAPSHAGRAPGWLAAALAVVVIGTIAAGTLDQDVVVAESESLALVSALEDDSQIPPPSAPASPRDPEAPEPPSLADDAAAQDRRAFAMVESQINRATSREQATRRCIESVRRELPVQFQGPVHALRGPCQALLDIRDAIEESRSVAALAMEASAAAPAVVEALVEPIEDLAAALAEVSRVTVESVEPVLAEAARTVEAELSRAVNEVQARASRIGQTATRQGRAGQQSGNYTWSNNGEKLEAQYRGEIEFTDDDTDVRAITPGGRLRITQDGRFSSERTLEFTADRDGRIDRRFWMGGSERPFEPEGRKWAAELLPRFIRQSGIGAASRVARIHRSKGTAGVLAEIALIEGSWAKRVYYTELFKQPSVSSSPRDVQQALTQAGREIDSDFELASLLISANHLVRDDATRTAYFEASRSIGSDFEMRRVFSAAIKDGRVAPALLGAMLETSTSIESDFELASLLVQIAGQQAIDGAATGPFFRALESVGSSFERRRVLDAVLKRSDLPPAVQAAALEAAAGISSDFECASVLVQFAKQQPVEGAVRAPFFKSVATIDSAFERGRVLQAVARQSDASNDTILEVLRAAQRMNGSFEQAQVLLAVAGTHDLTGERRDAYLDASKRLGSFEQGRVLSALVKNERRR